MEIKSCLQLPITLSDNLIYQLPFGVCRLQGLSPIPAATWCVSVKQPTQSHGYPRRNCTTTSKSERFAWSLTHAVQAVEYDSEQALRRKATACVNMPRERYAELKWLFLAVVSLGGNQGSHLTASPTVLALLHPTYECPLFWNHRTA